MWSEIAKIIGANPVMTIVITIIGTFSIWMYKEFKEMMTQKKKARLASIDEKIKINNQLYASVAALTHDSDNRELRIAFMNKIGEYSSLLSEDVQYVARDYCKYGDAQYLGSLMALVEVDLHRFNKERRRITEEEDSTDVINYVFKLVDPLKPLFAAWLFISFMLLSITSYYLQPLFYHKVLVIVTSATVLLSAIQAYVLISLAMAKQLVRHRAQKWLIFISIMGAPILSLLHSALTFLSLAIQITAIILLLRLNNKKKKGIITLE